MIEHIWTVICQSSIIDKDTNNISLINILEQLTLTPPKIDEGKGAILGNFEIVTFWSRTNLEKPATGNARIVLYQPSGEIVEQTDSNKRGPEYTIDLTVFQRVRSRFKFNGIPFLGAGVYQFGIEYKNEGEEDWKEVAKVPIQISLEIKM
jgi:hypothetical protein